MTEDFITSNYPKGFIDKIGKDYVIVKDIGSKEEIEIKVEEGISEYFKNEFANGEVIYVIYDKYKKELIL